MPLSAADSAPAVLPWAGHPAASLTGLLLTHSPSLSPGSLQVYQAMLASALKYLAAHDSSLLSCGQADLEAWLSSVSGAPRTRLRYITLLNRICDDLVEHGLRLDNPAAALLSGHRSPLRPLPLALLPGQEASFRAALPAGADWRAVRDRALLLAVLDGGLKVQDLQGLQLEDHVATAELTRLRLADGSKERWAPLAPAGARALAEWAALRGQVGLPESSWLFPSDRQPAPLHAASIYRVANAVFRAAGLTLKHQGTEVLRATFAARQFRAGKSLKYVQTCLGHRFPESTLPLRRAALGVPPA